MGGRRPPGGLRETRAQLELLPDPPDVIISGLNAGSNAGINVLYSGTVAAAIGRRVLPQHRESPFLARVRQEDLRLPYCGEVRGQVIEQLLERGPAKGSLFNVNIPVPRCARPVSRGERTAAKRCRRIRRSSTGAINRGGRTYFWASPEFTCP